MEKIVTDMLCFAEAVAKVVADTQITVYYSDDIGKDTAYEMMKARMNFKSQMEKIANSYLK